MSAWEERAALLHARRSVDAAFAEAAARHDRRFDIWVLAYTLAGVAVVAAACLVAAGVL